MIRDYLAASLLTLAVLGAAGALCWFAVEVYRNAVEERRLERARQAWRLRFARRLEKEISYEIDKRKRGA